ncbi:unnamed protein product [Effrenium voratum]|nr:unnamed protein product [Effrenium voratum]
MCTLSMAPMSVKVPSRPQSATSRPQSARSRTTRPQSAQSRRSDGEALGGTSMLSYKGLMSRQQHHNRPASAGRRILPAELGLAGRRVLTLPSHVDQCDQGESCCWRWLAHAVLKEAAWLKEDLDSLRKEHAEQQEHHTKVENCTEDLAELRGAHKILQQELRTSREQCDLVRQELLIVKTSQAQKLSKEEDLVREVARLEGEKSQAVARMEDARQKHMQMERETFRMHSEIEDLKRQILFREDDRVRAEGLLKAVKKERDELKEAAEATKKRKAKAKPMGRAPRR